MNRTKTWIVGSLLLSSTIANAQETEATKKLRARSVEFREEVIKVADGVYTSVGHTVSTVSMIVGSDGIIIVDTGLDGIVARQILAEFRKITMKPVQAVIFTHGHGDHTGGAGAFVENGEPQVWARANFGSESRPLRLAGLSIQQLRGARQAGFLLPGQLRINNGIAPAHQPHRKGDAFVSSQVEPTHTFETDRRSLTMSGVEIELIAAPGETDDQLCVWLPRQKVLFSGDNFYKSFPNLYAIRGTPYRDVRKWGASLERMVDLNAEALVGGHTRPIIGQEEVKQVLTDFRDAVQFVHDKTVEGMNKGLTPDQLVDYVRLPKHLAEKDYLVEYYGNVQWSVRSVFNGYLGWFDGNPSNLFPLTPREEALRIAKLAGGKDVLLERAREALEASDCQWAAQLADYLLALDDEAPDAKRIKADALTKLAENCVTATGRNYYLTVARQLRS